MLAAWSSIFPTHKLVNIEIIAAIVEYYKSNKTEIKASSTVTTLHMTLFHCIQASLQLSGEQRDDMSNMGSIRLSHSIYLTHLLLFLCTPTFSASMTATATENGMGKRSVSLNIVLLWRLLHNRYVRYILY